MEEFKASDKINLRKQAKNNYDGTKVCPQIWETLWGQDRSSQTVRKTRELWGGRNRRLHAEIIRNMRGIVPTVMVKQLNRGSER